MEFGSESFARANIVYPTEPSVEHIDILDLPSSEPIRRFVKIANSTIRDLEEDRVNEEITPDLINRYRSELSNRVAEAARSENLPEEWSNPAVDVYDLSGKGDQGHVLRDSHEAFIFATSNDENGWNDTEILILDVVTPGGGEGEPTSTDTDSDATVIDASDDDSDVMSDGRFEDDTPIQEASHFSYSETAVESDA